MKSLIIALMMVLPFVGMCQKVESAVFPEFRGFDPDSINRGNVKFIRTKGGVISQKDEKELQSKLIFSNLIYYMHKDDSIVYNRKGLNTESYFSIGNPNKKIYKHEGKYDSLNNIIEKITTLTDGTVAQRLIYTYDCFNNCIDLSYYNRFMKKTSAITIERKQNGNVLTEYVYGTDSTGERKLGHVRETEWEGNKKTVSTYNTEGNLTHKMVEEKNGNTTYTVSTNFASNGKGTLQFKSIITSKKNKKTMESVDGNTTFFSETTVNDNGDAIKMHVKRYTRYTSEKIIVNYVITYRYEYDSKGNYTKMVIYLDKKPVIEINRVIGYYD